MSAYTCLSCHVAFASHDLQRDHFRSDWHRYNLKRKVAELPPISAETFTNKVLAQKALAEETSVKFSNYCECCRKLFSSQKTYDNHARSKRHVDAALKSGTAVCSEVKSRTEDVENENSVIEEEEVDSDEWEGDPVPSNDCLFCSHHSSNFEKNQRHMMVEHSFFIPDIEYCTDTEALVTYLGEKVGRGMRCLWCSGESKAFWTLEAVQQHMLDKGHCKMHFEGDSLLEYGDYYDYSSSYPDADMSSPDDDANIPVLSDNDFQLVLPSGATIGHRSLQRYYKQRLNPNKSALVIKKQKMPAHSVISQYRALGWKGATKSEVKKRACDLSFMRKMKEKYNLQVSMKTNKLQNHFRPQVMF